MKIKFLDFVNEKINNTQKIYQFDDFYILEYEFNSEDEKTFFLFDNLKKAENFDYNSTNIGKITFIYFENSNIHNVYKEINGEKINPDKESAWYLKDIWVNNEYIGKRLGFKFLNKILKLLDIEYFYLSSTMGAKNRWLQLGKETGYYYDGDERTPYIKINTKDENFVQ